MYHNFFIHSSVEGHLGCFKFLTIVTRIDMNMVEDVSFSQNETSFGYMPLSGIAGS